MKCECGCGETVTSVYRGKLRRFIFAHHLRRKDQPRGSFPSREKHFLWKGGHTVLKTQGSSTSYAATKMPGHPRCVAGDYVPDHVLIAEKALGKFLPPKAVVHHWDRNGLNNENSNLLICENSAYHRLIHQRMSAFEKCGHADWKHCIFCKAYGPMGEFISSKRSGNRSPHYYHRTCHTDYYRDLRKARKQAIL